MPPTRRAIRYICLSILLGLLLSGCALRAMFGNVIIVEDIGEEVNEIITTVFSDSTAAVCLHTDYGFFECTYIINGEIITSTLYLLSEFGITGVLIDPLILQIPADVTGLIATYDDGSGAGAQPLARRYTTNIPVTPQIGIQAEAGQKFVILELPASVTAGLPEGDPDSAPEFSYAVEFRRSEPLGAPIPPMNIKVMLAGKAVVNGNTFYVPTLPCTTTIASVPAIEIPVSQTAVDLLPAIGDLLDQGSDYTCDHTAYTYFTALPAPIRTYLPVVAGPVEIVLEK